MLYQGTRNKKQRKNDKVDKGRLERIKKSESTDYFERFANLTSLSLVFRYLPSGPKRTEPTNHRLSISKYNNEFSGEFFQLFGFSSRNNFYNHTLFERYLPERIMGVMKSQCQPFSSVKQNNDTMTMLLPQCLQN